MAEKRKITGKAFFNVFVKTANKLKRFFVCWVWQFQQMFLGLLLVKLTKAAEKSLETPGGGKIKWWEFERNGRFTKFVSGVSLAVFILLPDNNNGDDTVRHEHGHSVQSSYLGWLYLPVVGVYSAVFCNLWQRFTQKDRNRFDRHYWYYITRWTERWADRLGGVDREKILAGIPRPEGAKYPNIKHDKTL